MHDWDDLRYVLALSRARTMKAAAEIVGTNSATISRRIDRLTKEVGRQLFKKGTGGWHPTAEALKLIEISTRLEEELRSFESSLSKPDTEIEGAISISCYQGMSLLALTPNLDRFYKRYPNLTLNIDHRQKLSLARGEVDLALRLQRPIEGRLISKRIGARVSGYFVRKGSKIGSQWIGLTKEFDNLPMMQQGFAYFGAEPTVRLGSLSEIETAVLSSDLPGPLLTCAMQDRRDVEQIASRDLISVRPIYLTFHESRRNDLQLQTVKSWVESCFSGPDHCLCGRCRFDVSDSDNRR
ncbi:LysR family transcriptional regulator [Aliiroseovarius sp. KMU-50]|uniref:LysR family transcriptional regulator n=1 Tax=Aliiroseovarius salicola TaxID=3009082 RepID=A0ABT4W016_9RHOB|nr:LysR family transcriptional regulator [Aliiroseovarius sp. KMU-50]MDA5093856.1 LysR family transcriptional regulator [Aliiroseovarius sp. KMU-50]